jgi:hypothetical protein
MMMTADVQSVSQTLATFIDLTRRRLVSLELSGQSWERHDDDAADLLEDLGISTGSADLVDMTAEDIEGRVTELMENWEVN